MFVEKIKNGTVIDHVPVGLGLQIMKILGVDKNYPARVALIMNVASKKMGRKDVLKVEDKYLDRLSLDRISLVAPGATINLIKDGDVVEKRACRMPKIVGGIMGCPNPKCITNLERVINTFFVDGSDGRVRCKYCERVFLPDELI
ncbi:MAG: aspartate carbamoyltransferase regulatory subunit [Candidatus Anstonellales archaeon]